MTILRISKETIVREVAKLLPLPELFQSIVSIKANYIARKQITAVSRASNLVI
jgi:exocyst complex component 3